MRCIFDGIIQGLDHGLISSSFHPHMPVLPFHLFCIPSPLVTAYHPSEPLSMARLGVECRLVSWARCQDFAPLGPCAGEYTHPCLLLWEILGDRPLAACSSPAHFHPFLIQAITNLFGIRRGKPILIIHLNGIGPAGQSEL